MCCRPVKKKRRRRRRKGGGRRGDPKPEPVEDAVFLDEEPVQNVFAQENVMVDRPSHNIIDPLPMAHQEPSGLRLADSITYSNVAEPLALADPLALVPPPHENRETVEVESERVNTTLLELEEEKREVVEPYQPPVVEPPVPAALEAKYPPREFSVEKHEEYRNPTPEVKRYILPQKISVNVYEAGRSDPLLIPTNTTDTVFELRFRIFEATRILPTNQILVHKTRELQLQRQLGECGIEDRSEIELTDHGKDITEYIIEITDAKNVRQLKSDLRKLEYDLKDAKKRSADKLRQNEWNDASRLVDSARMLEVRKSKKVEELKEIHEKHKNGFRQLHVKIMRLFSEKRKSAAEYAKLKIDLIAATQKNEVLRSREIVEKLMIQFIRHDGCERELMLLEAFVPDMVEAAGSGARDEGETKKTPSPRDFPQYAPEKPQYNSGRPAPRGQPLYDEDRYYTPDARYRQQPAYQEQPTPGRDQWGDAYYEPQPQRQYEPAPQFISGGEGDPGAYYH